MNQTNIFKLGLLMFVIAVISFASMIIHVGTMDSGSRLSQMELVDIFSENFINATYEYNNKQPQEVGRPTIAILINWPLMWITALFVLISSALGWIMGDIVYALVFNVFGRDVGWMVVGAMGNYISFTAVTSGLGVFILLMNDIYHHPWFVWLENKVYSRR